MTKTDALLTEHLGGRARLVGQIHDEFLVIADEPVAERFYEGHGMSSLSSSSSARSS
jgi:hypothetical protein